MELNFLNEQGKTVDVNEAVFGREYNEALVHQIVVAFQANARLGTRAQLTREAVHHSTKKPWRQKGTGRARSGMTSSPVWRGGGRAFPNSPDENFSQKVNKKMYRAAMASIWSKLVQTPASLSLASRRNAEDQGLRWSAQDARPQRAHFFIIIGEEELDDNIILAFRAI
ncbi:MAG: 50S ribosomal protein L4 [Sutterella wadsworthensis]